MTGVWSALSLTLSEPSLLYLSYPPGGLGVFEQETLVQLDNVRISRKLAGAFALILAVIVTLGGVVLFEVGQLEKAKATVTLAETVIGQTNVLKRSVDQQESNARAYLLTLSPDYLERVKSHQARYKQGSAEMRQMVSHISGALGRMDALDKAVAAYEASVINPEIALAGRPETHSDALALAASALPNQFMDPVDVAFKEISDAQETRKAAALKAQDAAFRTTKIALGVGVLVALILSVASGLVLAQSIAKPIAAMTAAMRRLAGGDKSIQVPAMGRKDEVGQMAAAVLAFKDAAIANERLEAEAVAQRQAAAEERARVEAEKAKAAEEDRIAITALGQGLNAMASGDLTHRIEVTFAPNAEQLRADFNDAIAQLEKAVASVAANVAAIRSGSSEISQASDDLSRRTEQQAASLEETAAALDQITTTVNRTADGARQAADVVQKTRGEAEASGLVVGEAVAAMTAIEQSSNQIGAIIGVIDEIAFQTNLLALNAGVEAARAGDAGRGFAVVASEVRALAQRSAGAAKEIKTLITASSRQVEQGVDLVGRAGEALSRIVDEVAEINSLVSEISASAQEQATGLQQVNTAVNQMDQVTQQNAAMVEESTAASHSLAQEADVLAASVAHFRVKQATQAVAQRRAPVSAPKVQPAPVAVEPAPARTPQPVAETVAALKTMGRGGAALKPEAIEDGWEEF
ncbi:chemotaxis protein [Brevundimonas diminuta]|uniref:Chemotaxis protein n=1 Tax=Brevundimonas diminuta TaxID=293 RepID=A0A1Z3LW27_BREDI|nr:chemotaxis protein [Brevundimonas diminuta]